MKIDLSEVNSSRKKPAAKDKVITKSTKNFKFKNPFKRQHGPARDNDGKFTSGSGGLQISKKLNNKRSLSLIAMVALVGGFFVFQSFAASANGTFVTEMYQRCYNQMKTSGSDYDYWLRRLDGGENRNTVWAKFVGATGKPCTFPYPPASTTPPSSSNSTTTAPATSTPTGTQSATMTAAQITSLYNEILGRKPSQSEVNYWVDKSKTWTSAQIRAFLLSSNEAFKKNIATKLQEAQAWKTLSDAHVGNAKKYNDETYKISLQAVVSKSNLDTISQRVGSVRAAIVQVNSGLSIVKASYEKAVANNVTEVSQFKSAYDWLNANTKSLNNSLKNMDADYARANKTYEANLNFFQQVSDRQRQERDCRNRGGTPTWSGGCTMPSTNVPQSPQFNNCTNVLASSSQESIRACQRHLGVSADGIWGCVTERAFENKYPQSAKRLTNCGTPPITGTSGGGSARRECTDDGGQWNSSTNTCAHPCKNGYRYNSTAKSCLQEQRTPSMVKCKSGSPVYIDWGYSAEGRKAFDAYAFKCKYGFKSMSCPPYYHEASEVYNGSRFHFCQLN